VNDTPAEDSVNESNELAKERNREASDRTLLAWIRTSLALIAFGFGIDRIVNDIAPDHRDSIGLSAIVGLSFMALGIYALLSAAIHYRREIRMLDAAQYRYQDRRSTGILVATILAAIGALGFIGILVQAVLRTRSGM
jgi:putative membrane protein